MATSQQPLPITVVVPIKNEALNLSNCLSALTDFARVVVVDSGSTDDSEKIAREHGAQWVEFRWDGRFPKKRNWYLRNHSVATEWVLFVDADEQVTPDFVAELRATLPNTPYNGFWLNFHNYFMGRRLRHGDAFRKIALLRIGKGEYERIEEDGWSSLDMEVHEHLVVDGSIGEIKAPLLHNDFKSLDAYYDRHNRYSAWEASRFLSNSHQSDHWTRRQKIKYALLTWPGFPLLYFLASYIGKGGFLDGKAGLRLALSKMFYFYQIQFKIAELKEKERQSAVK